jgi:hypothetical protein
MHELLQEGAPSLMDILDLKAASKISMPMKECQMLNTIRAFSVVLAVAVGVTSDLYQAYKKEVIDVYESGRILWRSRKGGQTPELSAATTIMASLKTQSRTAFVRHEQ